jgi:hypothetical protein
MEVKQVKYISGIYTQYASISMYIRKRDIFIKGRESSSTGNKTKIITTASKSQNSFKNIPSYSFFNSYHHNHYSPIESNYFLFYSISSFSFFYANSISSFIYFSIISLATRMHLRILALCLFRFFLSKRYFSI